MTPPQTLSGDVALDLPEFDDPPGEPTALMGRWFTRARDVGVREPGAVVLATVGPDCQVSTRVVLAKRCDERGIVFTSHRDSRKGRELQAEPRASMTFYWRETLQQLTVAGTVSPLPAPESDALFDERPRPARATVIASDQGRVLADEPALREAARQLAEGGQPLPRPANWQGYLLVPNVIEFWHGSVDRLHRRLLYTRANGGWSSCRLQP